MKKPKPMDYMEYERSMGMNRTPDKQEQLAKKVKHLESERQDLIDALTPIAEEIELKIGSERLINESDWNIEAHIGQITLTVRDARNVYKALRNAGVMPEDL